MVPIASFVSSSTKPTLQSSSSSPFDPSRQQQQTPSASRKKKLHEFVPRKAAVQLTERARLFFRSLLQNPPRENIVGIMLNYHQSQSGEPRMVFSFAFVTEQEVDPSLDEGVSLEVVPDESQPSPNDDDSQRRYVPKPPRDARHDGLPKLYISHNAFLKVLGATVDVEPDSITPILHDREGNRMDPNA
jgi:hypothetical protein